MEFMKDLNYSKCLDDNWNKTGIINNKDPIGDCCFRMVFYVCTKELLTAKCGVPEEEVQEKDDVHFNYWNNVEIHENLESNCTDGKENSLKPCKLSSGVPRVTWSFTLQFTGIFVLCLFLSKFKL